jgi:hypothetical protein
VSSGAANSSCFEGNLQFGKRKFTLGQLTTGTVLFVSFSKGTWAKVMYGKGHCYDEEYSFVAGGRLGGPW